MSLATCRAAALLPGQNLQKQVITVVGKHLCRFCLLCNGFFDVKWIVDKPNELPKGTEPGIASLTCHAQLTSQCCSMMTAKWLLHLGQL